MRRDPISGTGKIFEQTWQPVLYLGSVTLFMSLWHSLTTKGFSIWALGVFSLIALMSLVYGRIFERLTGSALANYGGLTLQFVSGFLSLNTLLFVLGVVSPLGVVGNFLVASVIGIGAAIFWREPPETTGPTGNATPEFICLWLSGLATTLWCRDSLALMSSEQGTTVFSVWQDSFYHARLISAFSQSHGFGTIQDVAMAGSQARLYHYAIYILPATVSSLTGTGPVEAYGSFLLPFGVLLSALAAFCLASSIWGKWSGLAAAAALLLLPDSYQQGFRNKYLSYNFLQQVNPGGLYGVACAALAWLFVIDGCRRNRYFPILVGYLLIGVTLVYKAQLFVANAYLILIYPCLFLSAVPGRRRLLTGLLVTALFVIVVGISQTIEGVPTLRLHGGGAGSGYPLIVAGNFEPGFFGSFFGEVLRKSGSTWSAPLWAAYMVMLATFGWWSALLAIGLLTLRRSAPPAVLLFPVLVVANYIFMSLGLALDDRGLATPEDLLNRPLVWAYFAVVTWIAGGAYAAFFGTGLPKRLTVRVAGFACLALGLAVPFAFSRNLQTMPAFYVYSSFDVFGAYPSCLVEASRYIRDHGPHDTTVQDSENDARFMVAAMAERQAYAALSIPWAQAAEPLRARFQELETFKQMTDAASITEFARQRHIDWYVLRPKSTVAWPQDFLASAVFVCDGFRVFRLDGVQR